MSKKLIFACVALLAASVSFVAIAENQGDSKTQCEGQCPKACAKECDKGCPAAAATACAEKCSKECATECAAKECDKGCPAAAAKACAEKCSADCKKECCAEKCPADCKKECCAEKCPADCKKECCADGEAECKALCPVSGKAANKEVAVDYKGGKVFLCCPGCPGAFSKDTAKYAAKANQQLVVTGQATQVGCPITGGKVNADTAVELCGVKVGFCCNGCKGKATKAKADEQVAMLFGDKAFKKGFKVKSEKSEKDAE